MASLEELRVQIDKIDSDVVSLLCKRAELVLEVKKTKKRENIDVYSPSRERQILDRVAELAKDGHFPQVSLEKIFVNIISATRSLIGELKVVYFGPEFSVGSDAAQRQFGEAVHYHAKESVEDVFAAVATGEANFGVVPARTTSSGLITETFELFMQSDLHIIAEIEGEREQDARFVVIGNKIPTSTGRDKTSLVCSVKEKAGALQEILEPFSKREISLLKIESRPTKNPALEYVFFIDIGGHQSEPIVKEAIAELEELSSYLKVIGSYPLVCHS